MKRLLTAVTAILLAFGLAGCASDPSFSTGKVVDKFYQPERDWNSFEYSPACGMGFDGQYTCGKYKFQNVHHHQSLMYQLRLENCQVSDKNGNTIVKKDGSAKCFRKWIDIDPAHYYNIKIGDDFA